MVVILVLKEYQTGQDESWLPGAASGLGARPELRGKGVPAVPGAQQQCVGRTVLLGGSLASSGLDYQPGMALTRLSPCAVLGGGCPASSGLCSGP